MKPILFNTEMVQAILEGRKTVTRRPVKTQPDGELHRLHADSCFPGCFAEDGSGRVYRPPYMAGDVLYVRETWARSMAGTFMYRADDKAIMVDHWLPSIHMPREAARIFLRVTAARAERLQSISHEDAEQEGCWCDESGLAMPIDKFAELWDSTIPKNPNKFKRYPYYWKDNPWVWVIEFEKISKEEAMA